MMQHMEGLQYAITLDINIGYYTIRIFPAWQDMTTIITEIEKSRYNCLPMGMCTLVDILQSEVDRLLGDVAGVKTYIDDIFVLIKKRWSKQI